MDEIKRTNKTKKSILVIIIIICNKNHTKNNVFKLKSAIKRKRLHFMKDVTKKFMVK